MINAASASISGVKVICRTNHIDSRGRFSEIYRVNDFDIDVPNFVQDNLSYSKKSVLRGMHFQVNQWQLLTVLKGTVLDVTLDLDGKSPTFLKTFNLILSEESTNQILIPPGVAHGFAVLSDEAVLHYKSSVYYGETPQYGVAWDSAPLVELWPNSDWIISKRDSNFPTVEQYLKSN